MKAKKDIVINEAMQSENETTIYRAQGGNRLLDQLIETLLLPEEKLRQHG
jgi:hypothetical protein